MTYAVGWQYGGEYYSLVAETSEELEQNTILWRAIQQWLEIANGLQTVGENGEEGERAKVYIYAHNGSRFDAVAAIQTILANSPDVPTVTCGGLCGQAKRMGCMAGDWGMHKPASIHEQRASQGQDQRPA